jgi:type VI secretion system protein ImpE
MADAGELFRAGHLAEALNAQIDVVRSKPSDQPARLFLFELLSFSGDWDRAAKHIDALSLDDPDLHLAAANFRNCLVSEKLRSKILSGGTPEFFLDPTPGTKLRQEAFEAFAKGDKAEFATKINQANDAIPTLKVTLNSKTFELFRDADDLFAGVFEVFAKGSYYWVPMEQVVSLAMNPPKVPRDLLWIAANMTLIDGSTGPVYLPGLYLGSPNHGLETVRIGRERDWMPIDPESPTLMRGFGPRVYLVGDEEANLTDIHELTITS